MPPIMRYDLFSCVSNGHGATADMDKINSFFFFREDSYKTHIFIFRSLVFFVFLLILLTEYTKVDTLGIIHKMRGFVNFV